MPERSRTTFFVISLILTIAAGVILTGPGANFTAEVKASILVAAGTLALAFTTWWSVSETRAVVTAEDRRHQQSFAPLLYLGQFAGGFRDGSFKAPLDNEGQGIAQRIRVSLPDGIYTDYRMSGPSNVLSIPEPNKPFSGSEKEHFVGVIAQKAQAFIVLPGAPGYPKVKLTRVHIEYFDMFGNPYATDYSDLNDDGANVTWTQPQALRIPSP